jgi:hypothetical protein
VFWNGICQDNIHKIFLPHLQHNLSNLILTPCQNDMFTQNTNLLN